MGSKSGPKVVVVGAGSMFFGRQALWHMSTSKHLQNGTLAYVDLDGERLDKMVRLGQKVVAEAGSPLKVIGSTDRREMFKGADFVVLTFADRGVKFRGVDCEVSEQYGVRMCSGDTIGPGGIFRAMRELPKILEAAKDVERICPDAWLINFINPAAVNGIGMMRHAPKVKSFALCDGLHMPRINSMYMKHAGIISDTKEVTPELAADFDMRIAGVNHFTYLLKAEYKGRDVIPQIVDTFKERAKEEKDEGHSKSRFNNAMTVELYDILGVLPTCIAHTKEYVPYWQGHGTAVASGKFPPLAVFDASNRQTQHDEMWKEIDEWLDGTRPVREFLEKFKPDHATDIIESMVGDLKKPFYIQTANNGAVSNFQDDAFFELLCDIDMDGVKPRPVGEMPVGVRALQHQVLDTHELTVEAIVSGRKDILRRAMAIDPIVNNMDDADRIIDALLAAESDALPDVWKKYLPVEKRVLVEA